MSGMCRPPGQPSLPWVALHTPTHSNKYVNSIFLDHQAAPNFYGVWIMVHSSILRPTQCTMLLYQLTSA